VEITNFFTKYQDLAVNTYHVNPTIFVIIYLLSIPFFYLSLFHVIKEVVALKNVHGKFSAKHFVLERKLSFWTILLLLVYISPYLYVMVFGQNLPLIVWLVIVFFVFFTVFWLYLRIRNNADSIAKNNEKKIWRIYSHCYDGLLGLKPYRNLISEMQAESNLKKGDHVLDIGVGTGNFEDLNTVPSVEFTCLDFSEHMMARAQKKSPQNQYEIYDVNKYMLPVGDNKYDRIISSNVIYNVKNLDPFFVDTIRVLKPGSRFIITTSVEEGLMPIVREHFRESSFGENLGLLIRIPEILLIAVINLVIDNSKDYIFYPEEEIVSSAKGAGYRIIKKKRTYGGVNTLLVLEKPHQS
jgi:ubiquinone/menaquinone biosynthesis C-methylase UbiE